MGFVSRVLKHLRYPFRGTRKATEPGRPWWDDLEALPISRLGDGPVVQQAVDNRVLLLGLDEMYRTAMKAHERTELLGCAKRLVTKLRWAPAEVPIEGYYVEDPALTTYFLLMRALQEVPLERTTEVADCADFNRLLAVTSSPLFGTPVRRGLMPIGRDPLSEALRTVAMADWSVPRLTSEAAAAARTADDFSLVGLAASIEDPVVLAALRESVVLYAEMIIGAVPVAPPRVEYTWNVDPKLAAAAGRFVDAFNGLFGAELPPPIAKYAPIYGAAYATAEIAGRCARIGQTEPPARYYHWAVRQDSDGQLSVHDFWDHQVITTDRYRRDDMQHDVPELHARTN